MTYVFDFSHPPVVTIMQCKMCFSEFYNLAKMSQ